MNSTWQEQTARNLGLPNQSALEDNLVSSKNTIIISSSSFYYNRRRTEPSKKTASTSTEDLAPRQPMNEPNWLITHAFDSKQKVSQSFSSLFFLLISVQWRVSCVVKPLARVWKSGLIRRILTKKLRWVTNNDKFVKLFITGNVFQCFN